MAKLVVRIFQLATTDGYIPTFSQQPPTLEEIFKQRLQVKKVNKLNIFIKDTFFKIVKSMSFIMMLLTPLIMIGIVVGIGYFASKPFSGTPEVDIAVISEDSSIGDTLSASEESIQITTELTTVEEARATLVAEEIDAYLEADWEGNQLTAELTHGSGMDTHIAIIQQVLIQFTNDDSSTRVECVS